jgi:hypothetical protein
VPTLVVSARDDLFNTLPGACWTAEHVPNAGLMFLESGGHLLCGQVAVLAQPGLSGTGEKASESGSVRLSISDNALG